MLELATQARGTGKAQRHEPARARTRSLEVRPA